MMKHGVLISAAIILCAAGGFSQSKYVAPTAAGYDKYILVSAVDVKDAQGKPVTAPDGRTLKTMSAKIVDASVPGAKKVSLYTIKNKKGMTVSITNYGAKIEQIMVPDKKGVFADVALGYETIDQAIAGQGSFGSFVGRYANRIAGAKFTLDGKEYSVGLNETKGPGLFNMLHGGVIGSRFIVFDAKQIDGSKVEMSYTFKDGEEGFPGTLAVKVIYSVTDKNELSIAYQAEALDKDTVANFTTHTFFNLSGDLGSEILDHVIRVNAAKYLQINAASIPTGKLEPVKDTPLDFTKPEVFGSRIKSDFDQIKFVNGYDHHFALDKKKQGALEFAASAYDPKSGRFMEVFTTEPGLQLHSGNNLAGQKPRDEGKGYLYIFRSGFNMEPSHFPDSPNQPSFPSTVIKKGQKYTGTTVYKFSVK
jgi:aldose 1-epimerase